MVLDWIILKVAQRCNLNCKYCYVYNRGDESWKSRPALVTERVLGVLAGRIAEHCDKHSVARFTIELHGGEPLLLGKRRMRRLVELLRRECPAVEVAFTLQTNGLLLDQEWLKLFADYKIQFGISCDGPTAAADRRRVRHDGTGTTSDLLRLIEQLRSDSSLFDDLRPGMLCVVDPSNNGAKVVRWFVRHGFGNFDFLLPDGTYVNPPQGWNGSKPYERFLLEAFDEWHGMGSRAPRIRFFELLMRALLGIRPGMDYLGGDLRRLCVIESDGSIGLSDLIRICGGRYARDDLNVFDDRLDAISLHYDLERLQVPGQKCRSCRYYNGCGGGLLPHRFDGQTFDGPSIYCSALYALADRMFRILRAELPDSAWTHRVDRNEMQFNGVLP